ncbi:hypothetical protein [Marixanthomonas spongiae]|uniref:hypothetical protein n=1 Tax=Marixanthomonas spongiae TaxID=2174845 RepID=UPI001058198B|nr:hypothetical protein [Marixanthomonas spongiae]
MRNLQNKTLCLLVLIVFTNCSKKNDDLSIPENSVFEPKTELISLTEKESNLTLAWKPVIIDGFINYKVYRLDSHTDAFDNPNLIVNLGELVYQTDNNLNTEYVDNEVPYNSFINYAVVTEYFNEVNTMTSVTSINYLSYENEDLFFSLTSLEKLADGSFKLVWEQDFNNAFENYTIYTLNNGSATSSSDIVNIGEVLHIQNIQENTSIIDNTQYTDEVVSYAVSKKINGKIILSKNFLSIENPRNLSFLPSQTLKNPNDENEIIIINKEGGIVFYNVNTLNSQNVEIDGKIFYCSIGKFNGIEDLYVPSENGKVYVIDLNTYEIKEIIDLNTDYNIISAIAIDNHILFLEKHFQNSATIGGTFVYDRVNNNVLNRNGSYTMNLNSKLIFAKENYFFFVVWNGLEYQNTSATRRLNINGNEVSIDLSFNDSRIDSRLFALSSDQSYFVSTEFGYQSTINYPNVTEFTTGSYSNSPIYGDVKITENDNIYFTVPTSSRIDVFLKNGFNSPIVQYATIGEPLFIEIFENHLISINQIENSYFIETIPKQ